MPSCYPSLSELIMPPSKRRPASDWLAIHDRFVHAREWLTLEEMGTALGMTPGTFYKHTAGWIEERKELENKSRAAATEMIIFDRAQEIRNMDQRHLDVGRKLQLKAARTLLKKLEAGEIDQSEFESGPMALAALRLGSVMEAAVLLRKKSFDPDDEGGTPPPAPLPPGGMVFTGPNIILPDGQPVTTMAVKSFTTEDLKNILARLESNDTNRVIEEGSSAGAPGEGSSKD